MAKMAVVAKLVAKEGMGDDMAKALGKMVEAVENEPGTEVYVMHRSAQEPDAIWFYELYTDAAANGAHSSSDAMKQMITDLADLIGGRPEITLLEPVAGKGIRL
jgi:quinol monooxygenase YgiN